MARTGDIDEIAARTAMVRRVLISLLAVAGFALIFRGLLISPGEGVPDVHLPDDVRAVVAKDAKRLGAESPHAIGSDLAPIARLAFSAVEIISAAAWVILVYALIKRRTLMARIAGVYLVLIQLIGPTPAMMQPPPPIALSAQTVERIIGPVRNAPHSAPDWARYMFAQIAYIHGDRQAARRLSANIDFSDYESRGEAQYRLQHLRGEPVRRTNVCLRFRCLSPGELSMARTAAIALCLIALLAAAVAGWLLSTFRARLGRVGTLDAQARALGLGAYG